MPSVKSSVFISYSQIDTAAYTSLCVALEGQSIDYWNPKSMAVGASLREQLRDGIANCDVCIFIVTRHSLESKWCSAEVGAFWGIGRRVVVFIADSQITDAEIPPQFQGDLWTRDVREVVRVIKGELTEATKRKEDQLKEKPLLVSEMTSDMLYAMISSLIVRGNDERYLSETLLLLKEGFPSKHSDLKFYNVADARVFSTRLLKELIGKLEVDILSAAEQIWKNRFILTTDSGDWRGLSLKEYYSLGFEGYIGCLLLCFEAQSCIAAALIDVIDDRESTPKLGPIIAEVGSLTLGNPQQLRLSA